MTEKLKAFLKGQVRKCRKKGRNKLNVTIKDPKCYYNTKLEQTTVTTVHSSAFRWLLVTIDFSVTKRN